MKGNRIKRQLGAATLPCEVIEAWLADEARQKPRPAGVGFSGRRRILAVAGIVAVVAAAVITIQHYASPLRHDIARAIAEEVASNHAKLRPLDVEAETFVELRRAMDRFEFTLIEPREQLGSDLSLLGARYCSIQGRDAAQIRLRDRSGELHTLYETSDAPAFAEVASAIFTVDGSIVRIWRGDGLLFALATAAR